VPTTITSAGVVATGSGLSLRNTERLIRSLINASAPRVDTQFGGSARLSRSTYRWLAKGHEGTHAAMQGCRGDGCGALAQVRNEFVRDRVEPICWKETDRQVGVDK